MSESKSRARTKTVKSEDEIRDLLQKSVDGNEQAFGVLMKEYNSLVVKVIEQTLTKNNFHTVLSVNYKSASEELASSVWFEMYKKFEKKALFEASIPFVIYISKVSRNVAKSFMEARIKIRRPEESVDESAKDNIVDGSNKDKKYRNLQFESIFDLLDEDIGSSPDDYNEQIILETQYHNELLKVLTEREKQVLRLTLADYPKKYIAKEIGKTIKTVYNDMKEINDKLRSLMK